MTYLLSLKYIYIYLFPAMSNVPLSSPGVTTSNTAPIRTMGAPPTSPTGTTTGQSKLDELREWSFLSTYKFTRQLVS